MVFRCLSFTAIKSTDRNKGKTANNGNSGTVGVGVAVGFIVGAIVGIGEGVMVGVDEVAKAIVVPSK